MDTLAGMDIGKIWSVAGAILVILVAVFFGLTKLLKGRNLSTPVLNITESEKERIQADSRELSDNQMRTAKIHIGSIKMLMVNSSERLFPQAVPLEKAYISLLAERITDNLLEQFRIDLVRNHIIKKSDDDLKVYTQAKASTYYTKVRMFLNDYNACLPGYDLKKIMDEIPYKDIYDIYYESYVSAKQLSTGY